MTSYTSLDCEMKESSDETKTYTVSCHFAGLTKEQRDHAYTILKGEKDLIDAARRIEKEIFRKPRKHDLIPKEAGSQKRLPARDRKKLTNDEILTEYKKMPFINRIVKMGASIHRVRSVVRGAGLA